MNNARPKYENDTDRKNELFLARAVCGHLGLDQVVKLPAVSYGLDYALLTKAPGRMSDMLAPFSFPQVLALLEVKARGRLYEAMLISSLKLAKAESFIAAGLPVFFAWGAPVADSEKEWDIALWRAHQVPYFALAGRTDRGDATDIEPMAMIELSDAERFVCRET